MLVHVHMTLSRFDNTIKRPDYVERRKSKPSGLEFNRDIGCAVVLAWVLVALLSSGGALSAYAVWTMEGERSVKWAAVESNSLGCQKCGTWLTVRWIRENVAVVRCECGYLNRRPLKVKDVA